MTPFEPPADLNLHNLLKQQADRAPDSIAITAPGRLPLTYSRLLDRTELVVNTLNDLGIERNDRVAVVLPNGSEMAVTVLGVAATASCTPLNPDYRTSEFQSYFAELKPKALIVEKHSDSPAGSVAQSYSIPIIELCPTAENNAGILVPKRAAQRRRRGLGFSQTEDVALLLFTSGTTARPKLVPLTHHNLLTSALHIAAGLHLAPEDCCLNVLPLFHIHGVTGALLSSFAAGASVVCTPGFNCDYFLTWLEEFRPTWFTAVPTIHQAVLSCLLADPERRHGESLRFIRSCSAPLPSKLIGELEELFHVPVIEAYGMTEASHQISSNPLPPNERKEGSVGLATGTEISVIDHQGNMLSAGEVGEIVIRGANVISRYAADAESNKDSFSDGWFRTGDQGYQDDDGYLYILGRLKEIINRGGAKISPFEVDRVLSLHPAVAEAISFALPHPSLGDDIGAAVVMKAGASATEGELRDYLAARLAAFKVPARIIIVDEIPRAATGKIQRLGLAEVFAHQLKDDLSGTRSPLETVVANIYAEVLGIKRVDRQDNFFLLGGDSLRATQVLSRIRAAFEINLPISTVFRKPTLAELSKEIGEAITMSRSRLTHAKKNLNPRTLPKATSSDETQVSYSKRHFDG